MSNAALTILQDGAELEGVSSHRPQALAQTILTFDLELHLELTRRGLAHLTPWDVVGPADRPRLERLERAAHDFWRNHAVISHRGIDLLKIAAHRHVSALSRMVWVGYVTEMAIGLQEPGCVLSFADLGAHGLEQPPHCRRLPLLSGIVQSIARDRNIRWENLSNDLWAGTAFEDAAASQVERTGLTPVDAGDWGDRPFILLTGSGEDLVRQLPVIRAIESTDNLKAIQVYRYADDATAARLHANGHIVVHDSQIHLDPCDGLVTSACDEGRRTFDLALRSHPDQTTRALGRWIPDSHLDFVFGTYAKKLATQVDRWHAFFDRHQPEAVVAHYPDVAVAVAHLRGMQTMVLPHGGLSIGDTAWYRSMPDVAVGVSGTAHANHLRSIGIDRRRIEVLDGLDDERHWAPYHGTHKEGRDGFEILLVTSRLADHAHDAELPGLHWKAAIESLREFIAHAHTRGGWRISIKTHPRYDHLTLYQNLNETLPPDRRINIVTDRPLSECVAATDAVVFANITSSSILEASQSHKPVVLLRDPSVVIHRNPRDRLLDGWPRVTNTAELIAHLLKLATDDSFYKAAVSQTQQALAEFIGRPGPSGSFLKFIQRKRKARVTYEGNPCPLVGFK